MKNLLYSFTCTMILFLLKQPLVFAAVHPIGGITFYNSSNKIVTAEVSESTFGKFNLPANEQKNISYSSLSEVCSANPTHCKAQFYVNHAPAGSATINAVTGKLINMNLIVKVHTTKIQHVLRSVVIQ